MSQQAPAIGRIVHYTLNDGDIALIDERQHSANYGRTLNKPVAGETCPAVVVRVWPGGLVNLRVLLDGLADHWATSRARADDPTDGHWSWPPRV